jgi:hypothetical protein
MFVILLGWLVFVFQRTIWATSKRWLPRAVLLLAAIGLLSIYAYRGAMFVLQPGYAFGYTDIRNTAPEVVAAFESLPAEQTIYTNDFELFYYLADRPLFGLPPQTDQFSGEANPDFERQLETVETALRDGAVFVVYTDPEKPSPVADALAARLITWQHFGRIVFYRHEAYLP